MPDTPFALTLAAAILAVLGAVAGPFLARFAAVRTLDQELPMALDEERTLLLGVLEQVGRLPYLTPVRQVDFASGAHGRIWAALRAAMPECDLLSDDVTDDECSALAAELNSRHDSILADVAQHLSSGPAPVGDGELLRDLVESATRQPPTDVMVIDAGAIVLDAGMNRTRLGGAGLVLPTVTPDSADPATPPLHRVHVAPSRMRLIVSAFAAALSYGLAPVLTHAAGFSGLAAVLGVAAVVVLATTMIVVSLVDIDTMFIDMKVFLGPTALAWLLVAGADVAQHSARRMLAGVIVTIAIGVFYEILNKVHRLIRKEDGQGMGDTIILLATVGVPGALTGNYALGIYSVLAASVAALIAWMVGFSRGQLTRSTPFAMGPFLATGWMLAWFIVTVHPISAP